MSEQPAEPPKKKPGRPRGVPSWKHPRLEPEEASPGVAEFETAVQKRNRLIIDMRYKQALTQQEIADRFHMSQQGINKILSNYRRGLNWKKPRGKFDYDEGPLETKTIDLSSMETFTRDLGYENKPFHLEWYRLVEQYKRFLLIAPRSHAKSTCISILYVLWKIVTNPDIRILIVSNTDIQARSFVRTVKQMVERFFPILIPEGREKWAETAFTVKRDRILKEATLSAVGVTGPIISRRQDLIVCDDVVDRENAATELSRTKVYDWFRDTLLPAVEPQTGRIIVIGTPWWGGDLYEKLAKDWKETYKRYDAIVDEEKKVSLWPERIPYECPEGKQHESFCCLMEIKRVMGVVLFNCQFRCDVSGLVGNKLRQEWLKYYTDPPKLESFDEIVIGVDPAIRVKESADYFAMATVGYSATEGKMYVLDFFRAHIPYPKQLWQITEHYRTYRPLRILLEVTGYQEALAQGLEESFLPIIPVKPVPDKSTRILKISPYFEQGRILVKQDMIDFIGEYVQFDQGEHDDLLDALAYAVQDIVDRHSNRVIEHMPLIGFAQVFKSKLPTPSASPIFVGVPKSANKTEGQEGKGKVRRLDFATGKWVWVEPTTP